MSFSLFLFLLIMSPQFVLSFPIPLKGFPLVVSTNIDCSNPDTSPIVSDFNNDGFKEILITNGTFTSTVSVYLINHIGSILPGWPKTFGGSTRINTAAGDVNKDGFPDIIIKTENILTVLDYKGNSVSGFPVNFAGDDWRSVKLTLYDLDNNGDLEIITNRDNVIGVFEHDGTMRSGWPFVITSGKNQENFHIPNFSVGDLNNDSIPEIIALSEFYNIKENRYDSAQIYVCGPNGNVLPNFPIREDSNYFYEIGKACIIYKDIESDSTFFSVNSNYSSSLTAFDYTTRVSTYNYNASLVKRFFLFPSIETFGMQMADLNNDNSLDYVIGSWFDTVRIYSQNGNLLFPNPIISTNNFNRLPSIGRVSVNFNLVAGQSYADTNGVSPNYAGYIKAFNPDGSELNWSPLRPSGIPSGGVVFDDLNNDGQADMIFVTNIVYGPSTIGGTKLYAYTFPGVQFTHNNFPWPMYGHDRYRTFNYDFFPNDEYVGIQNISNEIPESFELFQNYPNPFNNSTIIQFKIAKSSMVELNIYNLLGEKISNLIKETLKAGTFQVTYKPENLSTGVYFFRLTTNGNVFTRKMLLVK